MRTTKAKQLKHMYSQQSAFLEFSGISQMQCLCFKYLEVCQNVGMFQVTGVGVEKCAGGVGGGEMRKIAQDCNKHSVKMKRSLKELPYGLHYSNNLV